MAMFGKQNTVPRVHMLFVVEVRRLTGGDTCFPRNVPFSISLQFRSRIHRYSQARAIRSLVTLRGPQWQGRALASMRSAGPVPGAAAPKPPAQPEARAAHEPGGQLFFPRTRRASARPLLPHPKPPSIRLKYIVRDLQDLHMLISTFPKLRRSQPSSATLDAAQDPAGAERDKTVVGPAVGMLAAVRAVEPSRAGCTY